MSDKPIGKGKRAGGKGKTDKSRAGFELVSPYQPKGDQPAAIEKMVKNLGDGERHQVLLGVTGSGKTFSIANVVQEIQRPTLVLAHNKTLAAQLCAEFKEFFPNNAVSYFVSYYDYYQPEAYIPSSDTYIEKDASINEEINKFRHAATVNLLTRRDVLIVSSVSCIYGLGDIQEYEAQALTIKKGEDRKRDKLLRHLTDIQYVRSVMDFKQGMFHVLGDTLEIFPPDRDTIFRLEFFGDEIERITEADSFTGEELRELDMIKIFPAKHDITNSDKIKEAVEKIRADMEIRVDDFKRMGKIVEAERIRTRTEYDLEILQETGYCTGIENYTRYLNLRELGSPPATLLDYFPDDYLLVVDESHITIPQIGGMHNGNFSRKQTLIDFGFRLPSSHDNRPMKFDEFEAAADQTIYVSATPGPYELGKVGAMNTKMIKAAVEKAEKKAIQSKKTGMDSGLAMAVNLKGADPEKLVVEQIIRPTGLVDPMVEVRPSKFQIDDLMKEIQGRVKSKERVLVTTLTKRSAEDLTDYLADAGVRVKYLHSDIETIERIEILRDLRLGKFDVLVGINLLREGLDLPEVSLIGILDADKEGFLRSTGALIQTIGRAARNVNGFVIMYADRITESMKAALAETERRRNIQIAYNTKHGITPETIRSAIKDIGMTGKSGEVKLGDRTISVTKVPTEERKRLLDELGAQMDLASMNLEFEKAAELRDEIDMLRLEWGL